MVELTFSCHEEEFTSSPDAKLHFSTDTIMFDTVFTTLGSVTKSLKVYNRNDAPVKISEIYIGEGTKNFRLNINGVSANSKENIEIRAKDSLYIFVEVTVDPTNESAPMLIQDSIVFVTNGNFQDVDLLAYGQDMHLIDGEIIETETWKNDKPYLIYNSMLVDSGHTLTIEAGTQLHFTKKSYLYVLGKMIVNGTYDAPVVFQGDRLEWFYDDVPGQWEGIWFLKGSTGNKIDHAIIKNGNIGIQIDSIAAPNQWSLELSNTKIEHMTVAGFLGLTSSVLSTNCVFADCGYFSVALRLGGNYEFYHCTIGNYWSGRYSLRSTPALFMDNYWIHPETKLAYVWDLTNAYFGNCIIYGDTPGELLMKPYEGGGEFNYTFENCLLRVDTSKVDTKIADAFINCIVNPKEFWFLNIDFENMVYDYHLDTISIARDAGNPEIVMRKMKELQYDIELKDRTEDNMPDIGAYEGINYSEEEK